MKHKIKFKIVKGNPVIICSKCSETIRESKYFDTEDWKAFRKEIKLDAQYCDKCSDKIIIYE